mgnify:CR=1 FL=1
MTPRDTPPRATPQNVGVRRPHAPILQEPEGATHNSEGMDSRPPFCPLAGLKLRHHTQHLVPGGQRPEVLQDRVFLLVLQERALTTRPWTASTASVVGTSCRAAIRFSRLRPRVILTRPEGSSQKVSPKWMFICDCGRICALRHRARQHLISDENVRCSCFLPAVKSDPLEIRTRPICSHDCSFGSLSVLGLVRQNNESNV